jgi:hypothetical protein
MKILHTKTTIEHLRELTVTRELLVPISRDTAPEREVQVEDAVTVQVEPILYSASFERVTSGPKPGLTIIDQLRG